MILQKLQSSAKRHTWVPMVCMLWNLESVGIWGFYLKCDSIKSYLDIPQARASTHWGQWISFQIVLEVILFYFQQVSYPHHYLDKEFFGFLFQLCFKGTDLCFELQDALLTTIYWQYDRGRIQEYKEIMCSNTNWKFFCCSFITSYQRGVFPPCFIPRRICS